MDAALAQRVQRAGDGSGVALDSLADDRYGCNVLVRFDPTGAPRIGGEDFGCTLGVRFLHQADDVATVIARRLDDQARRDVLFTEGRQGADGGVLRQAVQRQGGNVLVAGDATNHGHFDPLHRSDHRSLRVRERRTHLHRHCKAPRNLDTTRVQNLGALGRELEHFVVGDGVERAGARDATRIGAAHPFDVGVDLAALRTERRRQRHGGGVGAAAPQRRDLALGADTLEAGDDDDAPLTQGLLDACGAHLEDACIGVMRVGDDAALRAGVRNRSVTELVQRHRQERHRNPLARREQHVELARRGRVADVRSKRHELVGRVSHGRDHDQHTITRLARARDAFGDVRDELGRRE